MKQIQFENWLDLEFIYRQLKEKYELNLTTGLALNAGFDWDLAVLTGTSWLGTFYLYFNGIDAILDFDTKEGIANRHWHPADTNEAIKMVEEFMKGKLI